MNLKNSNKFPSRTRLQMFTKVIELDHLML